MPLSEIGKLILGLGLLLVIVGALFLLAARAGVPLGRLPGDFVFKGRHATVYVPLVTCLVISIVASVLMYLFSRFR